MLKSRHHLPQLLLCVLVLLAACRQQTAAPEPPPTATAETVSTTEASPPEPTDTLAPTATPEPTATAVPTDTPEPTPTTEPTATPAPTETPEPTPSPTATPTEVPPTPPAAAVARPQVPAPVSVSALTVREDETVAPPLTVLVSANREFPGYSFLVTGLVRNDGDSNYAGLGIVATFFREDESRHGPIKANLQCPLLAPGDVCPFSVAANAKGLTQVMLHPEGYPTTRALAPVNSYLTGRYTGAVGFVHITGAITNPNPVPIYDTTLSGVLLDGAGEIVSIGTDILVGAIPSGATKQFDIAIRYAPYVRYLVYVQAESR